MTAPNLTLLDVRSEELKVFLASPYMSDSPAAFLRSLHTRRLDGVLIKWLRLNPQLVDVQFDARTADASAKLLQERLLPALTALDLRTFAFHCRESFETPPDVDPESEW